MVREYDFFIFLIVNIVSDALGRGDILLLLLGVISQKNWDNASDELLSYLRVLSRSIEPSTNSCFCLLFTRSTT
jgi:hypothetical protein